jgi:DNA polymerase
MLNTVCADGRIRGLFQYYGANRTGRFAGRLVQVQNLPRNYMKGLDQARELVLDGDLETLEMMYGRNLMKVISQLLRTAFIPAPGKHFKVSDFSAIEARVLAWLAGENWKLEVFNTHGKIYEATGARMFGLKLEDIKKGSTERDAAKVSELALGYQGAIGALTQMIEAEKTRSYEQGKPWTFLPSDEEKEMFVARWRAANPKIKQLWYDANEAAITAVAERGHVKCGYVTYHMDKNVLFCVLPSGRKLSYVRPMLVPNKFGGVQVEYEGMNQTTKKWEKMRAYGGLLVENICQAVARDVLVAKMVEFYGLGADMPLHVHDEIVIEDDNMFTMDEINQVMGKPVKWAPGLPLKGESFETFYYKKED